METRFQTSFIPKKPVVSVGGLNAPAPHAHSHSSSLFMTIAMFLFIVSLVVAGGMYFWKSLLLSSQESYKEQIAERERQFNADLIEELKSQNIKIDLANRLMSEHIAVSYIFEILGRLTAENVRFTSLDLTTGAISNEEVKVTMRGYGTSLSAVAFQSDVLNQLEQYGLRKIVKNPILSDPSLDANGTVAFGFTATIDPAALSYAKNLEAELAPPPADDASASGGAANQTP